MSKLVVKEANATSSGRKKNVVKTEISKSSSVTQPEVKSHFVQKEPLLTINPVLNTLTASSRSFGLDLNDVSQQLEQIKEEQEPPEVEKDIDESSYDVMKSDYAISKNFQFNDFTRHGLGVSENLNSAKSHVGYLSRPNVSERSSLSFSKSAHDWKSNTSVSSGFDDVNNSPKMEIQPRSSSSSSKERSRSSSYSSLNHGFGVSTLSKSRPNVNGFSSQNNISSFTKNKQSSAFSEPDLVRNYMNVSRPQSSLNSSLTIATEIKSAKDQLNSLDLRLNSSYISDVGCDTTFSASADIMKSNFNKTDLKSFAFNEKRSKVDDDTNNYATTSNVCSKSELDSTMFNSYHTNEKSYFVGGVFNSSGSGKVFPIPIGAKSETSSCEPTYQGTSNLLVHKNEGNSSLDSNDCIACRSYHYNKIGNQGPFADDSSKTNYRCGDHKHKFRKLNSKPITASDPFFCSKRLQKDIEPLVPKLDLSPLDSDSEKVKEVRPNVQWDILIAVQSPKCNKPKQIGSVIPKLDVHQDTNSLSSTTILTLHEISAKANPWDLKRPLDTYTVIDNSSNYENLARFQKPRHLPPNAG